ncbi:MAG: hypothetical protein ABI333_04900 [bacterium]
MPTRTKLAPPVLLATLLLGGAGCSGSDIDHGAVCGNALLEQTEVCDGTDLNNQTCFSQGFATGTLRCGADCGSFDTGGCTAAMCGNGVVEAGEVCDGSDLNGQSCTTQGFSSGTLGCQAGCTAYNISGCSN